MRMSAPLLMIVATLAACNAGTGATAETAGRPLVDPAELAALKQALLAEIEQNRTRSCEAPVLRGEATAGPADAAILALLRPTAPEIKPCTDAVAMHEAPINAALVGEPAEREPIAEVEARCANIDALVLAAASHADACSPFLAGRNPLGKLLIVLRLSRAVSLRALLHAREGDVGAGLDLALAGLRVNQDLSRGPGAPLIAAMVGAASMKMIIKGAVQPLLEHEAVTAEQVDRTRVALGRLLEAEQQYGTVLAYERTGFVLETVLPALKDEGWEPPGGWPGERPEARGPSGGKTVLGDPKQDMAITWVAINESAAAVESACPVDADMAPCLAGLEEQAHAAQERAEQSPISRYLELLAAPDPNRALRRWIVEILAGIAIPSHERYVRRYYGRRFVLAAARLHAAVRGDRLAGSRCPSESELSEEPWKTLLLVPGVEGAMRVVREEGGLLLRAPEALEGPEEEAPSYRVPCG